MSDGRALRVNQLDAARLDDEVTTLLKQQLAEVTVYHSDFWEKYQPELDALIRGVLWRYSIGLDKPTPGGQMQNVVYSQASHTGLRPRPLLPRQKLGTFVIHVLAPWLLKRLTDWAEALQDLPLDAEPGANPSSSSSSSSSPPPSPLRRWGASLARLYLRALEPRLTKLLSICSALNFLLFLRNGVFSTLGDRLVGVRLVHVDPSAHRYLPMQLMNRVMIWNGLSEFLMAVTPLLNLGQIRQTLTRKLTPARRRESAEALSALSCGFCGASPMVLPVLTDCGHKCCYFCLASEEMTDPGNIPCPRCSMKIQSFSYAS